MTSPDAAAKKAVINELSALAQSVWFTLLGALAFLGIVLLSSTDADFLLNSSETALPLVDISVPTERFFLLAPLVTTVLYLYLHFFCLKLWAQISDIDPKALDTGINPTLINDLALHLSPAAKPRGGIDWAWVSGLATMILIWASHPALLLAVIYKSGAANGGWELMSVRGMTFACLLVSLAVGLLSFAAALGIRYRWLSDRKGIIAVFLLLAFAGWAAADFGRARLEASLPTINIDRANLAAVGPEWPLAAERREAFRIEWCNREEVALEVCGLLAPHDVAERARIANLQRAYCLQQNIRVPTGCRQTFDRVDAGFAADWGIKRKSELGRLPELDLAGRDLSRASAQGARLVNARLEGAQFAAAQLAHAQFEGAILISAHLEDAKAFYASFDRANLTGAFLSRADLVSSRLEGATLLRTTLDGADLTEAQLADAELGDAVLTGANLSRASLRRADFKDAVLAGAILDGADLSGARNLTQDQLADAVGDKDTVLPVGLHAPALSLRSCWPKLPAKAAALVAGGTLPADVAEALKAHVCPKGEPPETFPRRALPYPTRVDPKLANARYLKDRAIERASLALRPRARPALDAIYASR